MQILLRKRKPIESHIRTIRREARQQAKDHRLPLTPKKAHSCAIQAANKQMRMKLYASKSNVTSAPVPIPRRSMNKKSLPRYHR